MDTQTKRLLDDLVGRKITSVLLVANSLRLYIESSPAEEKGWMIWLEPTWNYHDRHRVVAGSRQAQDEDDGGFRRAADALSSIEGDSVLSLEVDPVSSDLQIKLSREGRVQTFASDPEDDCSWYIKNLETGLLLEASPSGLIWPES